MPGPLAGLRILDLTWALAGPYGTMILGDLGAEVIKVERPGQGDPTRWVGPTIRGVNAYFLSINRGKRSLTLDLKQPRGREVLLRLAQLSDVLVENFTPGTMEKLGLAYEVVRQYNTSLIYASCSGFGQTGPYANRPAYDMIIQGMGGGLSITGEPGRPPVRVGYSIGDLAGGLFLSVGILAALQERQRSGQGQRLDVGLLDCQVALCENAISRYFATGVVPGPLGTRHPLATPFQVFPTRDDYVVLAMLTQAEWVRFCEAMGRPDLLQDERFQDTDRRTQNHHLLEPILEEITRTRTTAEWIAAMDEVGIACGPVNTIDRVVSDPQVNSRRMIAEVSHPSQPQGGGLKVVNTPIKLSHTPPRLEEGPPEVGQHTDVILHDLLGLDAEEIAQLRQEQVI